MMVGQVATVLMFKAEDIVSRLQSQSEWSVSAIHVDNLVQHLGTFGHDRSGIVRRIILRKRSPIHLFDPDIGSLQSGLDVQAVDEQGLQTVF